MTEIEIKGKVLITISDLMHSTGMPVFLSQCEVESESETSSQLAETIYKIIESNQIFEDTTNVETK